MLNDRNGRRRLRGATQHGGGRDLGITQHFCRMALNGCHRSQRDAYRSADLEGAYKLFNGGCAPARKFAVEGGGAFGRSRTGYVEAQSGKAVASPEKERQRIYRTGVAAEGSVDAGGRTPEVYFLDKMRHTDAISATSH